MNQPDSMFIQRNETGEIYHLCYTDNTRDVISRARFTELLPLTQYDHEDGVYWFRSNYWTFAETPQDAPKTHGGKKVVPISRADGTTETDTQWWARQGELADYRQSVDGSSYRGQQ